MSGKLMMSLRLEEDDKNQPTSLASSQWVAQVFQCSALLCTLFGRAQFNSNLGSWVGLEISTRTTLFKRNYNIYFYVSKVILGNIFLLKKSQQNKTKTNLSSGYMHIHAWYVNVPLFSGGMYGEFQTVPEIICSHTSNSLQQITT